MIGLYDRVKVKKTGFPGNVVSIDDNHGKDDPIYFVEIDDEHKVGEFLKDMVWCELDEIENIKN